MQYFGAFVLTLLGLANCLQCTEVNGGHNTWSNGPRVRLEVHPRIEEWPHNGPGKKLVLHKKNEPLNMTCTVVYQNGEKDDETPFDYIVDWKGPRHVNNNPKIERGQSKNTAWIWFERLAEKDAGDYTCMAVSHKPFGHQSTLSVFFYLFVEHKPVYCGSQWFRCRSKNCIMERYVCDGKQDCEEGEDESPAAGCGLEPCLGKVFCEDRCIPPDWCCDHRNCSGTFGLRPWPHENHEISYVQTAFYTVIGCAMAFMFIVTILVIAICRVQIKRAMNSRCSQQNRNINCGRRTVPLYDLDVYLNRTADVNYPGGVSIMYNINSGVQFVGRPAEPPPYSEVIAEPPREGPPPPYVSCENLIVRVPNPRFIENTETPTSIDALPSTLPRNQRTSEIIDDNNPPDTDIRGSQLSGEANQRENSIPNVPGPQVAISTSSTSQTRRPHTCTMGTRQFLPHNLGNLDGNTFARINNVLQTRDNVDAAAALVADTSRSSPARNFELEYVETDALLAENSEIAIKPTKETITWKPYSRHALMKSRWLSNERRDKSPEKNWYRHRIEKGMKDCSTRSDKSPEKNWYRQRVERSMKDSTSRGGREASSSTLKDSENEGVFLDTDQADTTPVESSSSNEIEMAKGFADFTVDSTINRVENIVTPTCSSIGETSTRLLSVDKEQRDSRTKEIDDKHEICGDGRKKKVDDEKNRKLGEIDEILGSCGKKTTTKSFLRDIKRQSSLTNEEIRSKNLNESSACASTVSVDLPNPRLVDNEAGPQIRQVSSLVLPLRESFIGVQRDS